MAVPTVEERLAVLETGQTSVSADVHEIKEDLKALRADLAQRPSWIVTTVITILFGSCTCLAGLLVAVSR